MNSYRVLLAPNFALGRWGVGQQDSRRVVEMLEGAVLQEAGVTERGLHLLDIAMACPSHAEVLNDIFVAAQELGYAFVNATVTEWADRAAECAVFGGFGAGGAAHLAAGDQDLTIFAGLLGTAVGAIVGSFLKREEVVYEVRLSPTGEWLFTRSDPPEVPQTGFGSAPTFG